MINIETELQSYAQHGIIVNFGRPTLSITEFDTLLTNDPRIENPQEANQVGRIATPRKANHDSPHCPCTA